MTGPAPGQVLAGRFTVVRPLGTGSFGRTLLAREDAAGRDVAVKLLQPRAAADWKALELFEREIAVLRSLRHHGIPEVYDVVQGEHDGAAATLLVMEFVDGVPLATVIAEGRHVSPERVIHWLVELLGILDYLHGRVPPVLHRDIKPANILVRPDGSLALVDFGAVRRVVLGSDEHGSTVAGTYGYMPYEQYMGQATAPSDLYALGATFLHLITGRPPAAFMSDEGRLQVPETLPGDPRLRAVLARLLHPSPADRFASAREVREALFGSTSTALAPRAVAPRTALTLASLGPAPRPLEGEARALYRKVAPSAFDLMDGGSKRSESPGIMEFLWLAFFSVLTAGVLPAVFFSVAHGRRGVLRRFFRDGVGAEAEVTAIELEDIAFGEKWARVSYAFTMDGKSHRDSDRVLPSLAHRWRPGDRIEILVIAEEGYDSVIISTS